MNNFHLSPSLLPETKLWRYMSLDKFIDIISSEELYFSPLTSYNKTDPYEGLLPKVALNAFSSIIKDEFDRLNESLKPLFAVMEENEKKGIPTSKEDKERIQALNKMMGEHLPQMEKTYFLVMSSVTVNCWHQNDFESEGMWRLYSDDNKGIAIQTTVKNLVESIITDKHVMVSEVKYIDYFDKKLTPADCVTNGRTIPYLKRNSFAHEKEVRLSITPNFNYKDVLSHKPQGIRVKINPSKLIEKIYISPYVSEPYPSSVSVLMKRFNICEDKLIKSDLLTVDDSLLKVF